MPVNKIQRGTAGQATVISTTPCGPAGIRDWSISKDGSIIASNSFSPGPNGWDVTASGVVTVPPGAVLGTGYEGGKDSTNDCEWTTLEGVKRYDGKTRIYIQFEVVDSSSSSSSGQSSSSSGMTSSSQTSAESSLASSGSGDSDSSLPPGSSRTSGGSRTSGSGQSSRSSGRSSGQSSRSSGRSSGSSRPSGSGRSSGSSRSFGSSASSDTSASSGSSTSSGSGGNCSGISVVQSFCESVRVLLTRPSNAPPGALNFYFYVLNASDFAAHSFGTKQSRGRSGWPYRFVPTAASQVQLQVGEYPPQLDPDHQYKLFAEYYLPNGTYVGASCILSYRFDPALCLDGNKTNNVKSCDTINGVPTFCPIPVSDK